MQTKNYLKKYQPIVYQTFLNSIRNNRLSHAYLLSGAPGMPLLNSAIFLAQSLLCDHPDDLACETCPTCKRVANQDYADLMVIDNDGSKIKKGDVQSVILNFNKTALESKGIMIYIINLIENMTPVAVNSLLKFLEEPGKNVYALLTTENEAKILPTILSRVEILRFKNVERDIIIKDATNLDVNLDDAELLSAVYNDSVMIKELADDEKYKQLKVALSEHLESFLEGENTAIYIANTKVTSKIKDIISARLYLDLLATIFNDVLNVSLGNDIAITTYVKIINDLANAIPNKEEALLSIMNAREELNYNVNIPLLFIKLTKNIMEDK